MTFQVLIALVIVGAALPAIFAAQPIDIGNRRELFVDDHLIDRLEGGAALRLHRPQPRDIAIVFGKPWEGNTSALWSVFRDGDIYRMYYRASNAASIGGKTTHPTFLCYAESKDGIHWRRPNLGRVAFEGSKENNITARQVFTPFKDANPDCTPGARYKAFGVISLTKPRRRQLLAYQSADGLRWRRMRSEPVMTDGVTPHAFDTVNVAFWDSVRGEYRAYIRDWRDGKRDIKTATSKDFLNWSEPQWLEYPGAAQEELYTNMVRPYGRNPHLFIGFPTRYMPQRGSITEPLFMASRDARTFRLWEEAIIRPGRNSDRWGNRCNYIWYGLIETASDLPGKPTEYSIFSGEHYYMEGAVKLRRFTYRPDGFVSVNAPFSGGNVLTKPLKFSGANLLLNVSTAAAGLIRVEVQDADGKAVPGYEAANCQEIYGDEIERLVTWQRGPDVSSMQGRPVRLLFILKDADLFSFRFADNDERKE